MGGGEVIDGEVSGGGGGVAAGDWKAVGTVTSSLTGVMISAVGGRGKRGSEHGAG